MVQIHVPLKPSTTTSASSGRVMVGDGDTEGCRTLGKNGNVG
jgi:hypothetical protein